MKSLNQQKFVRILITGSLLALSVAVANGAVTLNSGSCVKSEMVKSNASTVYFENNSSKLTSSAKKALDKIVASQKGSDVVKVEITGFVSAVGPSVKHKSLATARAQSVKSYLASRGLSVQFVTKGIGLTPTKSTSSKARKATIQLVNIQQVDTGGKVPSVKLDQSAAFTASVGVPVSLKIVTLDPATKSDTANPTTLSISPDLPKGLSMDNKTGEITGTPTEEHRLVKYTITAKNNCGSSSLSFEMAISPTQQYFFGGTPTPTPTPTPLASAIPCNEHSPSGLSNDPQGPQGHGCDGIGDKHGMKEVSTPTGNVSPVTSAKQPEPAASTSTTKTYNGRSDIESKK